MLNRQHFHRDYSIKSLTKINLSKILFRVDFFFEALNKMFK